MKAIAGLVLMGLMTIWQAQARPIAKETSKITWDFSTNKVWGANLGNWLILERWMGDDVFQEAGSNAQDEWTFSAKVPDAAALLQRHWDSWIVESDIATLASVKANHVRIPVGYWAFITPDLGEPYIANGGQKAALQRILGYCAKHNIKALLDLHGLPGSQNGEAHSGYIGSIGFFSAYNVMRGLETVQAIVDWINGLEPKLKNTISGLEVANEPHANDDSSKAMLRQFYTQAYTILSKSAYKLPMVFHDAFLGTGYWDDFLPASALAVLDMHPYWAYSGTVTAEASILNQVCVYKADTFHLPVLYGEFSLATFDGYNDTDWKQKFIDSQADAFQHGQGAGGTFWALKNAIHADVWSFEQLVSEGIINAATFTDHGHSQC
ncbi:glycoside hydrolase [Hesseltinella vesiculosa]|uniref:glucan 1,3-beta-glucosidase n=1 Tax=Hesseltinella vesiculosa TaxID=101127 RepID=A0A1X2GZB7_9FUNG|nr:glycoside hydrolase [Hesseltinella vesiculosa]